MLLQDLKIAIVSDQLATAGGAGGAERVLMSFKKIFPNADVFAVVYNPDLMPEEFRKYNISTTFIQNLPFGKSHYQLYFPLMPLAIESIDLTNYDIVLTSSHSVAKGVITSPGTLHICYCHSPMRYAWDKYHEYLSYEDAGIIKRWFISLFMNYLRIWDVTSSSRVDVFVTNSTFDARRIQKYYRRESKVIHPPCSIQNFYISDSISDFYLVVGRMVGYKRVDLAIQAFNLLQKKLVVIGDGKDRKKLEQMAGPTVSLLGRVSDETVAEYYSKCRALIFAGEEDFGIVPVEAQASGRPVIAYGAGGALETVKGVFVDRIHELDDTCTGIFFREQTVDALVQAIRAYEAHEDIFASSNIRARGVLFSEEVFMNRLRSFVEEEYSSFIKRT